MSYKVQKGTVYLVGAGPGDLKLITVKAKEILEQADIIIYDNLINIRLLECAKPNAKKIFVGKSSGKHSIPQSEINELLLNEINPNTSVVRLKGGDPLVFGRIREEINTLETENIPYEIVPGITAAMACAAYTGIPITERDTSSSIIFLTGHENPEKMCLNLDFREYAKENATLCIYMGVGQMERIVGELIEGGLKPNTPVAIVENGSTQKQKSTIGHLGTIVEKSKAQSIQAPAIIFVGSVVNLKGSQNWFENKPLFGKKIIVPRARQQAGKLTELLEFYGADVIEIPLIAISPKYDKETIADVFTELSTYQWILFTSANGVQHFFDLFFKAYEDIRSIGLSQIGVVGNATAKAIESLHLKVDLLPESANSDALVDALLERESLDNTKILVVTGNKGSPSLVKRLETEGRAIVDRLPLYENKKCSISESPHFESFKAFGADAILFTSTSTVQNFMDSIKDLSIDPSILPAYGSIGVKTSETLKQMGATIDFESPKANLENLVVETISYFKNKPTNNK